MIFLRHPTPDIDRAICYGRTDMDIAEEGHDQIKAALKSTPQIKHIFASPARRCRKLTKALANRDDVKPVFDERLWEMHMGDWEGIPWKHINRKLSDHWLTDPINIPTPNGECFSDLQMRVEEMLGEISANKSIDISATAIVCHAGPIRATQMRLEGLTFKEAFAQTPPYAHPIIIEAST